MSDYRYNIYTGMAIDEFRKVEAAKRRLAKAEAEAQAALRRIPSSDTNLYYWNTELIRHEADRSEAVRERDQETVEAIDCLIVEMREQLRKEEEKAVERDYIARK